MELSGLMLYPVKSCGGLVVAEWEVDRFGLRHDRRWMVATPDGRLVSQRECPALALVRPEFREPHLRLTAPDLPPLIVPLHPQGGRPVMVRVWANTLRAIAPDHRADDWFSRVVGEECFLAYFPEDGERVLDPTWAPEGGTTGFADGFPFLLIGEASLGDLNDRLETPLPMNRFRPNLVVAGSSPFAEDGWGRIRVGEIPMRVVKPCARCVVTTTDQATGRRAGEEPLRTLATFRRVDGKVMFGQNVVHYATGRLRVGDPVTLESGASS
jgi:uncharacterized protein YcbX